MARGSCRSMWPAPAMTLSSADSSAASASSRASVRGTTSSLAPATIKSGRGGTLDTSWVGRSCRISPGPGSGVRRVAPGMDQTARPGLRHKAPGVAASVRELGRRRQRRHPGHRRVLGGGAYGQGAARRKTDQPDLLDPGDFPQRAHPGNQVGPPAAEREITLRRPDAPEVEGEHSRTGLGGQTCGQLQGSRSWAPRPSGPPRGTRERGLCHGGPSPKRPRSWAGPGTPTGQGRRPVRTRHFRERRDRCPNH